MIDYSETRRILRQAIYDNKLVVFVGSGISNESGLPLWGDVIKSIHEKLENSIVDKNDYLKIPQLYYNARGEKEYDQDMLKDYFEYFDENG